MLTWDGTETEIGNLITDLTKHNHSVIYWVGAESEKHHKQPETIFHNSLDALFNKPAKGFTIDQFSAPSKELIESLHHVEAIILTMMNSKFPTYTVDMRKHFYYNMLGYWQGILKQTKTEVIIFNNVPHSPYEYLIYELAQLFKIKTLIIEGTWISDRAYIYENFREPIPALEEQRKINADKNFVVADLKEDLQKYYLKQTNPIADVTPLYMPIQFKQYLGKSLIKRRLNHLKNAIKKRSLFKEIVIWFKKEIGTNLKKDYEKLQAEPDLTKPYVYAALHLQPEMTTSPQGDIFVDQILMLETISYTLPEGWMIYVKEHPIQWLFRGVNYCESRYKGFYEKIASLKNVQLVPVSFNSIKLVSESKTIATVTGTVAWEGVLRGKPGMVFGYPWYRQCEGVFTIKNTEDCQAVFEKIKANYTVEPQKVINFLHHFDQITIHGYINMYIENNTTLTTTQSAANIRQALLKHLTI